MYEIFHLNCDLVISKKTPRKLGKNSTSLKVIIYFHLRHDVIALSYEISDGMAYQSLVAISHYVLNKIFSHTVMATKLLSWLYWISGSRGYLKVVDTWACQNLQEVPEEFLDLQGVSITVNTFIFIIFQISFSLSLCM